MRNVAYLHDVIQLIIRIPNVDGVNLYLIEDCTISNDRTAIVVKLAVGGDIEAFFDLVLSFYDNKDRKQLLGGFVESMQKGVELMKAQATEDDQMRPMVFIIEMPEDNNGDTMTIVPKSKSFLCA